MTTIGNRVQTIRCVECGYGVGEMPGTSCGQPKWHRQHRKPKDPELLEQYKYLQEDMTGQQMGAVPRWVRARIHVEAMKRGISPNQWAGEIMHEWAKKNGGKP